MRKMRFQLVLIQCLFLIFVLGGSILVVNNAGPYFYRNYRISIAKEAFENLKDVDLSKWDAEETDIESYENMNFTFTIADESMKKIYQSINTGNRAVYRDIERRRLDFDSTPVIVRKRNQDRESIRLQGIIEQDGIQYYVAIKDKIRDVGIFFRFALRVLWCIFFLTLPLGVVVMYLVAKSLSKPIQQLETVVKNVAEHDFTRKAETGNGFDELNDLAVSINRMSEQVQAYVANVEEDKDKLMLQKLEQERMNRARKSFISNVSHELKTPLAVISSQVEMLQYLKDEERREFYYTSIEEEVAKMSEMVGNLLDMTVMEHNMGKVEKKEFSLSEMVAYILLKYDSLFKRKSIQVETSLLENCHIYGDREYIEQAVNNFVMNALQHTDKGNKIRLVTEEIDDNIQVRIFNQGMPIADKDMEKIWKSFYVPEQEKGKEEDNGLGHTGLGLYIVKTVMEMHGGKYGVRNVEDGVEFWMSIPKGL
ncbi:MAG: HAMP domain-containing histidine kinase [Lachnospiraceae bacterium]|nr:HAMP domain-containing histidine kinase [Lachnospiraceae bacterium]